MRRVAPICSLAALFMVTTFHALLAQVQPVTITPRLGQVIRVSRTVPTYLLGAGPAVWRGSPAHDRLFQALKAPRRGRRALRGRWIRLSALWRRGTGPSHHHPDFLGFLQGRPAYRRRHEHGQGPHDCAELHHHSGVDVQTGKTRSVPGPTPPRPVGIATAARSCATRPIAR